MPLSDSMKFALREWCEQWSRAGVSHLKKLDPALLSEVGASSAEVEQVRRRWARQQYIRRPPPQRRKLQTLPFHPQTKSLNNRYGPCQSAVRPPKAWLPPDEPGNVGLGIAQPFPCGARKHARTSRQRGASLQEMHGARLHPETNGFWRRKRIGSHRLLRRSPWCR